VKGKMRAAVKTKPAFGSIEIKKVDIPQIKPDEVLVKLKIASICGTDMHIYEWDPWSQNRIKTPLIQGHEWAAEVAEVGSACTWAKVGDYVSGEGHIACGHCYMCRTGNAHVCEKVTILGIDRPGSFAEYMPVPERNLIKNDAGLPLEYASIQDPLGNAVYTVFNGDCVAKDVAVFGLGPIGLMAVAICRHIGSKRVFAVGHKNEYRVKLAKKLGATRAIRSSEEDPVKVVMAGTDGQGVDEALEMSGSGEALNQAIQVLKPAGNIQILGIYAKPVTVNISDFVTKGGAMYGIHGRRMFEDWYRMAGLFKSGIDLMPVITHKFPLDDIAEAMELMRSGDCGKVALYP
jgi:threonine 3-dehydrogenase